MHHTYELRPSAGHDDAVRTVHALKSSFNVRDEFIEPFIERSGAENFRMLLRDGQLIGGLLGVPMGQYIQGHSVPLTGIVLVGVSPDARGRGAGSFMMRTVIEQLHAQGEPLSALYPATQPVYRQAGYEAAGSYFEGTLPMDRISLADRTCDVRPMTDDDRDTVRALYGAYAAQHSGMLDRGQYIWDRIERPRFESSDGYMILKDGQPDGYMFIQRTEGASYKHNLHVWDCVTRSPDSARRLLTFLADHRSMADMAQFHRPPRDVLMQAMPEQNAEIRDDVQWMQRIVDVEQALAQRAYPPAVSAEVHLRVQGDFIEANNDAFILRVENGRADVQRGGNRNIQMDIRALAQLYVSYLTPRQLKSMGTLFADEARDLHALTALFAGPAPWMADMF
jgi:predicted acetyltransferase